LKALYQEALLRSMETSIKSIVNTWKDRKDLLAWWWQVVPSKSYWQGCNRMIIWRAGISFDLPVDRTIYSLDVWLWRDLLFASLLY
jgi:hypothetical protein